MYNLYSNSSEKRSIVFGHLPPFHFLCFQSFPRLFVFVASCKQAILSFFSLLLSYPGRLMPSIEDLNISDSDDEDPSIAQSTTSSNTSQRGFTLEEKRRFLKDIDEAGGFDNLNLEALLHENSSFYGLPRTKAGQARKKNFQNLHYQWSKKHRAGTFGAIRKSLKQGFASPRPAKVSSQKETARRKINLRFSPLNQKRKRHKRKWKRRPIAEVCLTRPMTRTTVRINTFFHV